MSKRILLSLALAVVFSYTLASADTVVLKDGRVLQGIFKGGTESFIKFEVDGKLQDIAVGEVTSLTFSPRETKAAAPVGAVIPAGTKLMVKTVGAVSTASHKEGSKFKAVLETDVLVNGVVVVPKGAEVYGTVLESKGGKRVGSQRLVMTLSDLSINNQLVPIVTDEVGAEGGRGSTARKVGAGALIGAATGSAGKGAAAGAGVAVLAGGSHIQVAAGTLMEVSLKQPATIPKQGT